MKFELDESQIQRLEKWKLSIKEKYGVYGIYEYKFTPTGIGCAVEIYSVLSQETLDLSDYDKW